MGKRVKYEVYMPVKVAARIDNIARMVSERRGTHESPEIVISDIVIAFLDILGDGFVADEAEMDIEDIQALEENCDDNKPERRIYAKCQQQIIQLMALLNDYSLFN